MAEHTPTPTRAGSVDSGHTPRGHIGVAGGVFVVVVAAAFVAGPVVAFVRHPARSSAVPGHEIGLTARHALSDE